MESYGSRLIDSTAETLQRTLAIVNESQSIGSSVMNQLGTQQEQLRGDVPASVQPASISSTTATTPTTEPVSAGTALTPSVQPSGGEELPADEAGFASDEDKDDSVVPWTERPEAELRHLLSAELFAALQLKKQKMEEEKRKKDKEKPEIDNVFADMVCTLPFVDPSFFRVRAKS